ncbi:MAG: putative membrane protein [Rickettsiales bacterium]|jgi:uncharacterized membrane protein
MSNKSKFLKSATLAIAGLAIMSSTSAIAKSPSMEKCYGVVKAGKNDCSSAKKGAHSCAGGATIDGDKNEWIYLPKGACERLVNGLKR